MAMSLFNDWEVPAIAGTDFIDRQGLFGGKEIPAFVRITN